MAIFSTDLNPDGTELGSTGVQSQTTPAPQAATGGTTAPRPIPEPDENTGSLNPIEQGVSNLTGASMQPGDLMALLAGLANAVPGAKQIGAGVNALANSDKWGDVPDQYKAAMAEENAATDTSKQNNPLTYYATNLAASAPLYTVGGGLPSTAEKLAGAGLTGALQGGSESNARGNDTGTFLTDTALNGGLAMAGQGIGSLVGKGMGWLAGHGETAAIASLPDEKIATHLKALGRDSTQDAIDAVKKAANTQAQQSAQTLQKSPLAGGLSALAGASAGHLMGSGESTLLGLLAGPMIKDVLAGPVSSATEGLAKGAAKASFALGPTGREALQSRGTGGFNSILQYLNQPEKENDFIDQMTSPEARALSNPDNPLNK